jgi:cytochrome o ubiquinol oxidase subunit 1
VAAFGTLVVALGIFCQVLQIVVSIIKKDEYRDTTGDPWDGRTLEWSIPSPPPFYNFASTPHVHDRDDFWHQKQQKTSKTIKYEDIHMPRNTGTGFIMAGFIFVIGFALIWQIYWLAIIGGVGTFATILYRAFNINTDYYLKANEVEQIESNISSGKIK